MDTGPVRQHHHLIVATFYLRRDIDVPSKESLCRMTCIIPSSRVPSVAFRFVLVTILTPDIINFTSRCEMIQVKYILSQACH